MARRPRSYRGDTQLAGQVEERAAMVVMAGQMGVARPAVGALVGGMAVAAVMATD